jgi:hypothetical protein
MTVDPSSVRLRSMMVEVTNVLSTAGLRLSPSMFVVSAMPKNLVDLSYTLDLQSRDTLKYRNGGDSVLRMEHTLTISMAKVVKPLDQFTSQLDAFEIEERAIIAMSAADAFAYMRVDWLETRRDPTPSREHLILSMVFNVEMDWSWAL